MTYFLDNLCCLTFCVVKHLLQDSTLNALITWL